MIATARNSHKISERRVRLYRELVRLGLVTENLFKKYDKRQQQEYTFYEVFEYMKNRR